MIPKFKPKCYCGAPLVDLPFPLPAKGIGQCSGAGVPIEFEIEVDETKMVKDINGNLTKVIGWKVTGNH